jgi:hypothetical protein
VKWRSWRSCLKNAKRKKKAKERARSPLFFVCVVKVSSTSGKRDYKRASAGAEIKYYGVFELLVVLVRLSSTPIKYDGVVFNTFASGIKIETGSFSISFDSYRYTVARFFPIFSATSSTVMPISCRRALILSPIFMSTTPLLLYNHIICTLAT